MHNWGGVSLTQGLTEVFIFLRWKMKQGHRLLLMEEKLVTDEFPSQRQPDYMAQQNDPVYKKPKHAAAVGEPKSRLLRAPNHSVSQQTPLASSLLQPLPPSSLPF